MFSKVFKCIKCEILFEVQIISSALSVIYLKNINLCQTWILLGHFSLLLISFNKLVAIVLKGKLRKGIFLSNMLRPILPVEILKLNPVAASWSNLTKRGAPANWLNMFFAMIQNSRDRQGGGRGLIYGPLSIFF